MKTLAAVLGGTALFIMAGARADQLEMQNGDRISGQVLSLSADSVVLQSDLLGKVTLARSNVANIQIGNSAVNLPHPPHPSNAVQSVSVSTNHLSPNVLATMHSMGADTNMVEKIRRQFLQGAGPEANDKFDTLLSGLFDGKFDLTQLRAEAKGAADQIRELKKSGVEVGEPLNSYLAVLDKFLKESANTPPAVPVVTSAPSTNSPGGITIIR